MKDLNNKKNAVLDMCPVCNHKIRDGDRFILNSYMVIVDGVTTQAPPKVLCPSCGVDFTPKPVLKQVVANLGKEPSMIIQPSQPNIRSN